MQKCSSDTYSSVEFDMDCIGLGHVQQGIAVLQNIIVHQTQMNVECKRSAEIFSK